MPKDFLHHKKYRTRIFYILIAWRNTAISIKQEQHFPTDLKNIKNLLSWITSSKLQVANQNKILQNVQIYYPNFHTLFFNFLSPMKVVTITTSQCCRICQCWNSTFSSWSYDSLGSQLHPQNMIANKDKHQLRTSTK